MITQQLAMSFKSQQLEDTRANVFPAGCPNIPFSAPFCNSVTTTTGSFLIRLVLVSVQSGRHNLVIINVHFEPELTLRQLRGRLRLIIHPHGPADPSGVGIILGDFNIRDPEEGRFNVWNQIFTDGDCVPFFPHVLEVAQSDYTRRDATALGVIRTLSRIDRIFINLPMAEARDFHCYFMS